MKYEIAVTVGALLLVGSLLSTAEVAAQSGGDRCEFGAELSAELSASESERLRLRAGSGSLVVEGRAGVSRVTVTAMACASDERLLADLEVVLERQGSTLDLETRYPDNAWRGRGYARIDLRVEVPRGMAAEIDDGSGAMRLSGLGNLTVNDGSGEIHLEEILGSVEIDDGSGELEIRDVQGDVFVQDGSGDFEIRDVQGDVIVEDGSGSMDIVGVTGSVTVDDGSGSIDIRDVGQDVVAYQIGSGTIRVTGVEGNFTVRDGSPGRIRYSGVQGVVDIPGSRRR